MQTTLWALLLAMFTFAACVLATGHFICDRAFRKVWLFMGISTIMGALVVPALLWLDTGTLAALFIAVPGMLGLAGLLGGLFTSIGPQIYPSAVRASGYNLGHNLAMTLFGGVSPLLVTALGESVRPAALAAGVILLIFTGVSWVASVLLVRVVPRVNARATAGEAALLQ
jgi:MHS family proline/betaine transporter-like MFS transporter